jgi:hypothetical protein
MIFTSSGFADRVREVLDGLGLDCYVELPNLRGVAEGVKRLGTHAWPGSATMFFAPVDERTLPRLTEAVADARSACDAECCLKVMSLEANPEV